MVIAEFVAEKVLEEILSALRRPGSDLLSRVLRRSIIGAGEFNGRVRNGIGFRPPAIATKPAKGRCEETGLFRPLPSVFRRPARARTMRAIKPIELLVPVSFTHCCASTPGLSTWWSTTALMRDLVLRWVSRLDAFSGYPVHTIATRLRGWRHDRSTRGMSIPVLSY